MKRLAVVLILAVSLLFSTIILSSCKSSEPIKIGYVACLSGLNSELGVSGRNGMEIAVDEVNKAGGINGRTVELIVKDDENNPEIALKVDKEIVQQGAVAIVGHLTSGMMKYVLPYINQKDILMISPTVSAHSLSGLDDNFIRVITSNKPEAELLANEAVQKRNCKRIAAIYELTNKAYSEEVYSNFKNQAEKLGAEIIATETFTSGTEVSFYNIAQEFVNMKADAVLSITGPMDNAMLCQQLQKLNSDLPVFSGTWSMTDDLIKQGGASVERVIMTGILDKENQNKAYITFKEQYYSRYRTAPSFSSLYSYEAANMLFRALETSSDFKTRTIKDRIIKIRSFKGLQDDFIIDGFGDTNRNYHLFMINDGQFIRVDQ